VASATGIFDRHDGEPFFFQPCPAAQVLGLGNWEGELDNLVDFARQDTKTRGVQTFSLQSTRTEDRFTLRNIGAYILDPGLVNFSLGGTFGLSQEWLGLETGSAFRSGTLSGYDAFASILPDKPYSLNLFANRNQSLFSGGLPGRIDVLSESRGATLFARRLYIPSSLSFRQELQDAESRFAGIVARRREKRNIFTYQGERGWIDSEMGLRYEFVDNSDEVFTRLSYRSHDGGVNYSLDFGPELNWRWDSRLRFLTRSGVADLTTLSLDELLRIDHTERLWTDYRYFFIRTDTTGGSTNTHLASFGLNHRLYESLTTRLGLDNTFQTLPGGQKETIRSRLDFSYTKRLPGDGRLNAGLGGGLQYEDSQFRVTETFIPQETHTFSPPQPIILRNPFVILDSVVVTKVALGPPVVGCIPPPLPTPLVLGRDYTLRTVGDFTEILPIDCSGAIPGINPGDTIAVDYRFTVSPSLTFITIPWHFDLSADYRWIRPYFSHEQTNQSLVSGRDGRLLDDQRSDTVGTELRYDGQRLRASLLGEARWFTSKRVEYNNLRSNQFVGLSILPELTLSLSADESFFDFSNPKRETQTFTTRATLTYIPSPELFVDAFGALRWLEDTLLPRERATEVGLRARWFYRRVEISPSFEFFDRQRGNTDTKDFRATLRLTRRFSYP